MTGTINVEEPSMKHNFKKIEPKWQKKWEEQQAFKAVDGSDKPKFYGLVEFPYPSGAGMHVGHIKAYSSIEVLSRKRRMQAMYCSQSDSMHSDFLLRIMRLRRIHILVRSQTRTLRNSLIS